MSPHSMFIYIGNAILGNSQMTPHWRLAAHSMFYSINNTSHIQTINVFMSGCADLPEEVVCPACHSKMVVSLHPDMVSRGPPPVTMAGSAGFPGNHLDTLPLATSSTNTSPSKASRCTERLVCSS